MRRVRLAGWIVAAVWCAGLVAFAAAFYSRFHLAQDFGLYSQAWTQIGTGHFDPTNTIYGYPFYAGNLEVVMWPLALLHLVAPQPFTLLVVQDLCIAGSGLVSYLWIVDVLERSSVRRWVVVAAASVVLLVVVADPVAYQTAGFDFHLEPIATLFLLLAGRDLWRGRTTRAWLFAGGVLLCGAFAAIALVGLGISAVLAGSRTRRHGFLLVGAAVGWSVVVSLLHADQGDLTGYAYVTAGGALGGVGSGGALAVASGVLQHPARVVHHLSGRLGDVWALVRPAGVVGLASAWGFGVPVLVMLTDALHQHHAYIQQSFQNFAVFPFLLVGTVMVLLWLTAHVGRRPATGTGRMLAVGGAAVGAVALGLAVAYGAAQTPHDAHWLLDQRVGPAQASALDTALARTPPHDEVIGTRAVLGRFCERASCYEFVPYVALHVDTRDTVFVFAADAQSGIDPRTAQTSIDYLRRVWRARVLVHAHGVTALVVRKPPNVHLMTVPLPVPGHRTAS